MTYEILIGEPEYIINQLTCLLDTGIEISTIRKTKNNATYLIGYADTNTNGYLLLEDGSFLLYECGCRIILEDGIPYYIELEDGSLLLLEDGSSILLE